MHRAGLVRAAVAACLACTLDARSVSAHAPAPDPAWSQGYALVVLQDGVDLDAARRVVQSAGGTVALLLPPRYLTGWIPPELDAQLVGRAGIRAVVRGEPPVLPGQATALSGQPPALQDLGDRAAQAATRFYERASRGELDRVPASNVPEAVIGPDTSERNPPGLRPDAFPRGPVSERDIAANLQRLGIAPPNKVEGPLTSSGGTSSLTSNSDFMTGTVSVTLFFVESDGTGSDADVYDWTPSAEDAAFADAAAALSWWAAQAQKRSGCWVVFRLQAHFATQDPRCSQWREPVLHPSSDFASVVESVLGNFGYTWGGHLERASAFDAAMRTQNQTDWAYSAFAVANPDGPHQFTDGYAAWSYIGGPYLTLLQHSFSWTFKQVFAHESAHMFRACDEYYAPGYGGCSGCSSCADTGVPNGNCEECNPTPVSCMMRSNNWALCDFTAGQIGWWRTPCTQYAYPRPRVDAAVPDEIVQGVESAIDVHGDFFVDGAVASFGDGVEVVSQSVVSDSLLQARIRVPIDAAAGPRDVVVTGPDGQFDLRMNGLMVRATPRHFVSPSGGNTFPYDRPDRAARDLAVAVAAASSGDTILVAGGTYAPAALHRGVTILGGWANDFGSRPLGTILSIVDAGGAGPAVVIDGSGNASLLDALVLRSGAAASIATPELGTLPAGGALRVVDASPTLRDCMLESSTAGSTATPGAGGGGFFWRASPRLEQCIVRDNLASRGAGLFFLDCNATLDDVIVEGNDAAGTGRGGGIGALGSRVELHGGRLTGNFGARDGGGMHLESCPRVRFEQLDVDGNAASKHGGGLWTHASRIEAVGTRLVHNVTGDTGGGAEAQNDTLELESCVVGGNRAVTLGGGLHLTGCTATLLNVTVADNTSGAAGGVYWTGATATGSIRACIIADNEQGGVVVGSGAPPLSDWNVFAANGGLDRTGLGTGPHDLDADPRFVAPGALDFRLALGSPGLDTGDPDPSRVDVDGSRNDRGAQGGPDAHPPAPPRVTGLVTVDETDGVRLRWRPSTGPDIQTYVVHRDSIEGFLPSDANRVAVVSAPLMEWFDSAPRPGSWYAVVAVDRAGHASGASSASGLGPPSDVDSRPAALVLHGAVPNPANPGAWIDYEIPASGTVSLSVFTVRGARVRLLHEGRESAGRRRLYWDGRDDSGRPVASGVYWVRLEAAAEQRSRKLVVVR